MAHDHSHGVDPGALGWRLMVSILINIVITAAQLVGGVVSGSLALMSDALHNVGDVAALGLSYYAYRVGKRSADARYTFAFQRAEVLAALLNAAALIGVSLYVAFEAVQRLREPSPVGSDIVIALAAFGMVANAGAALLLRGHGRNLNVRGAMLHLVSDSVASLGVLLVGVVMRFTSLYVLDPIVSLALAAWMIKESWSLVRGAVHILMQGVPEGIELRMVEDAILQVAGVCGMHDLHVWAMSSDAVVLSAHIVVEPATVPETTAVASAVKRVLHDRFGVEHATLEIECEEGGCSGAVCAGCAPSPTRAH